MNTTLIGGMGEEAACRYLVSKGYRIVERNYKCKIAEIDIVAYDSNGVLCFCEVKTRRNSNFGYAYEAVNKAKIRQIQKGAVSYVKAKKVNCPMRCDVIEVYGEARSGGFFV
ncbi:MAG: YraN family protein, partial [Clostridia bacterium]|nr:YraN family protein [Clostridia bacterium]